MYEESSTYGAMLHRSIETPCGWEQEHLLPPNRRSWNANTQHGVCFHFYTLLRSQVFVGRSECTFVYIFGIPAHWKVVAVGCTTKLTTVNSLTEIWVTGAFLKTCRYFLHTWKVVAVIESRGETTCRFSPGCRFCCTLFFCGCTRCFQ